MHKAEGLGVNGGRFLPFSRAWVKWLGSWGKCNFWSIIDQFLDNSIKMDITLTFLLSYFFLGIGSQCAQLFLLRLRCLSCVVYAYTPQNLPVRALRVSSPATFCRRIQQLYVNNLISESLGLVIICHFILMRFFFPKPHIEVRLQH